MTVLPTKRRRLEQAAARRAEAARERRTIRHNLGRRRRFAGWVVTAGALVPVGIVILPVGQLHARRPAAGPSLRAGGVGLAAPVLRPGYAWQLESIAQATTPWQPRSTLGAGVPPPSEMNASSRAAVVSRVKFENWILRSGSGRGFGGTVGRPRFIGTTADRAVWRAEGSRPLVKLGTGTETTSQPGFEVGNRTFTYAQLLRLPTTPAGMIHLFPASGAQKVANQVSEMATALEWDPLPPAVRAAVFDAIAQLPHVQHLGVVRDPLGRTAVAFATTSPPSPGRQSGRGGSAGRPLPVRNELLFDPHRKALLATEMVLLKASRVPEIGAGYPISWTAYVRSRAVSTDVIPPLKAPLCGRQAVRASLAQPISPQTGEHAYLFAITNRSEAPCALEGYPHITLSHNSHVLSFVYRQGGGPYVTSQKPRRVELDPGARAYFAVAKYRCDGAIAGVATRMTISHIGLAAPAVLNLSQLAITDLDYCRNARPGPGADPGNTVTVSPFEASQQAALPLTP